MAVYIEDWSGHDTGSGVPAGWSARWNTSGKSYTISNDAAAPGGKSLRIVHTGTSNARSYLSWDDADADADRADIDILALIRHAPFDLSVALSTAGLIVRASGLTGNETGTALAFGSTNGQESGADIRRINYSSGSPTTQNSDSDGVWEFEGLYWLRFTVLGNSAVGRLYPYNDPKGTPLTTAALDPTQGATGVLRVGLLTFNSVTDIEYLWVGCGTGEDEAPLPAGWGEDEAPQGTTTIAGVTPGSTTALVAYHYDDTDASVFQCRIDGGAPASIGATPATISGLVPDNDYDSPGLQIRAVNARGEGQWSAAYPFRTAAALPATTVDWDIDAGNILPGFTTITDANTATPIIEVRPRQTLGGEGPTARWIHWRFRANHVAGKRPRIRVNVSGRYLGNYVAGWRPWWTSDHVTWHRFASLVSLSATWAIFEFPEDLTDNVIYISDHPAFRVQDFSDLAATLASDSSGLVSPSALADEQGVIGTSPAENDDLSRAVGEHEIYGFVLGSGTPTDDGGPKRWMIVDCGIHPGEILDGWPLRGIVDYYLSGEDARADKLRSNWNIGIYFCLTPNGRYGGNWRGNWRNYKDPNRDWGGTGAFALEESVIVRDAVLADLDGAVESVGLSLHTAASATTENRLFCSTALPDPTIQNAWLDAVDSIDGTTWDRIDTNIPASVAGWHVVRGADVGVILEMGTRSNTTLDRYHQLGRRLLEATAEADAQGYFYQPDGESGGSVAQVTVSATGTGQASGVSQGGSVANVAIVATGVGSAAEIAQGGSTAQLSISAQGAGFAGSDQAGGSTSPVTVSATGAGTGHESAQGGSTAAVSVIAEGAGIPSTGQSGGSTSNVIALPTGAGIAKEHSAGGSIAGISVTATGAGESSEGQASEGGSTAQIIVFPSSAGAAIERAEGGSTAGVRVKALGSTAPSFDGPAIIVTIPSENRIITIQERRTG